MAFLVSYGVSTAAGLGADRLWKALMNGTSLAAIPQDLNRWPVVPGTIPKICAWPDQSNSKLSQRDLLVGHLLSAWQECRENLPFQRGANSHSRLGVIFASTKGCIEDFVWDFSSVDTPDPLRLVLDQFLEVAELTPVRSLCISNACSSSHVALALANQWLKNGTVSNALILAADSIGPFTVNGFHSLKALAPELVSPFSKNRSGLQLGDGAAALWLSTNPSDHSDICVENASTITEGYAATRPNEQCAGLSRAIDVLGWTSKPSHVIAHGTGTYANDLCEDKLLHRKFSPVPKTTASKWCIGHTMGASGAIDTILAAEMIKRQQVFPIATTSRSDAISSAYQHLVDPSDQPVERVLVNSLGFGGVNGAVVVGRSSQEHAPIRRQEKFRASLHCHSKSINCPLTDVPDWSEAVERWYQLDGPAQALAEAVHQWRQEGTLSRNPEVIYLASRQGCFETDLQFAKSGAFSPAKFVHTLPSIRASSLLQILGITCPVFCIQHGEHSFGRALEAAAENGMHGSKRIWVINIEKTAKYDVNILEIMNISELSAFSICYDPNEKQAFSERVDDDRLRPWFTLKNKRGSDKLNIGESVYLEATELNIAPPID